MQDSHFLLLFFSIHNKTIGLKEYNIKWFYCKLKTGKYHLASYLLTLKIRYVQWKFWLLQVLHNGFKQLAITITWNQLARASKKKHNKIIKALTLKWWLVILIKNSLYFIHIPCIFRVTDVCIGWWTEEINLIKITLYQK